MSSGKDWNKNLIRKDNSKDEGVYCFAAGFQLYFPNLGNHLAMELVLCFAESMSLGYSSNTATDQPVTRGMVTQT